MDNKHLSLTLNAGNFYWFGYPLDEVCDIIIREFASKVKHIHVKNVVAESGRLDVMRKTWRS